MMDIGEFNLGSAIVKGVIFFLLSFVLGKLGCSAPVTAFFESVTQDVMDHSNKQPTGASHQIDAEIAERQRQLNQQKALLEEQTRQAAELRQLANEQIQAVEQNRQETEIRRLEAERSQPEKKSSASIPFQAEAPQRKAIEYGSTSVRSEVSTSDSPVRCGNCNGCGYFKCARCKGKGLILCGDCRGKGAYLYQGRLMRCQFCGGDGVLFSSCPDCHGFGRIACRECQR